MSLKPLYDRVVVRRVEAETTTESGIIIPDSAAEAPCQGEVIAVGDGAIANNGEQRALSVTVGDRVLFSQYAGTESKIDGEVLLIVKESEILAVIDVQADDLGNEQEKAA